MFGLDLTALSTRARLAMFGLVFEGSLFGRERWIRVGRYSAASMGLRPLAGPCVTPWWPSCSSVPITQKRPISCPEDAGRFRALGVTRPFTRHASRLSRQAHSGKYMRKSFVVMFRVLGISITPSDGGFAGAADKEASVRSVHPRRLLDRRLVTHSP